MKKIIIGLLVLTSGSAFAYSSKCAVSVTAFSTPGQQHVDYQHFRVYENGVEEYVGPCEGNQHITGAIVNAVASLFGCGKENDSP